MRHYAYCLHQCTLLHYLTSEIAPCNDFVPQAMADKNWDLAVQLRGRSFARNLETYKMLTRLKAPKEAFDDAGKPIVRYCFIFEIRACCSFVERNFLKFPLISFCFFTIPTYKVFVVICNSLLLTCTKFQYYPA